MIHAIVGTVFILILFIISSYFYDHKDRKYSKGKNEKIATARGFSFVYRYLQISTVIISITAFFIDHEYLFKIHQSMYLYYIGLALAGFSMNIFILNFSPIA